MTDKLTIRITSGPLAGKTGKIDKSEFDPTKMELAGPGATARKATPILGALLGALTGGLLGPVGVFAGGAAGYAGGKTMSRASEDVVTGGRSQPSRIELAGNPGYVGQEAKKDINSSAVAGATALSGYEALKQLMDLYSIAKGPKYVGEKRQNLISEQGLKLPREQSEQALSRINPEKYTSDNQKILSETKGNVLNELFPMQNVAPEGVYLASPPNTDLNRAYGIINQLENQSGVKYGGNSPAPVKDIFGTLRDVANQTSPDVAKMNKLYQKAIESQKYSDMAKGSVAKFILYKTLSKLVPGF